MECLDTLAGSSSGHEPEAMTAVENSRFLREELSKGSAELHFSSRQAMLNMAHFPLHNSTCRKLHTQFDSAGPEICTR